MIQRPKHVPPALAGTAEGLRGLAVAVNWLLERTEMAGQVRYNEEQARLERWDGDAWVALS